jgi:predicted MFS family arabinose efflux permease
LLHYFNCLPTAHRNAQAGKMIRKIANTYKSSFSGLSKETWLLSIVMLINRSSTMAVPFMSMYITQSMHRSVADAGLIITLFGVGSVLGSAAGGYCIDKMGFRAVQIFSSIIGGVLFLLFGQIDNFSILCAMTVGLSFVAEAFRPANMAAIAAYAAPENLTRSYSLNRLAVNLGWGVGSSLGGFLAAINYHLLFWVEGIVYMIVGALIFILLPAAKEPHRVRIARQKAVIQQPIWKDAFLLRFLIWVAIYSSCFIMMFRYVPVYWKETLHMEEWVIGLILGLNGIIIALFEMVLVRYWEGRKSNMYYIIAGVCMTAVGYAFLILPGIAAILMAVGAILFITVGEMLAFPFINTAIMGKANEYNRGKYAAAYALSWSVAQIVGPGGGALIVDRWGYVALWIVLVILCLLCALAFKILRKTSIS